MLYDFDGCKPQIDSSAFLAPSSVIIGKVEIGKGSSVWFNVTIRGDGEEIKIGDYTNIQDNSVVHITEGKFSTTIGDYVTIGHKAVIHAAHLKDYAFIGMGAIILDGAVIEPYGFVAAGALVPPGVVVESNTLVAGVPCRKVRDLRPTEIDEIKKSADNYSKLAMRYNREFDDKN